MHSCAWFFFCMGTLSEPYWNHIVTIYRGKRGTIDKQKGSKTDRHILDTFMFFSAEKKYIILRKYAENNSYICRMNYVLSLKFLDFGDNSRFYLFPGY